ncbi:MAG: MBL fold metallo-hydrolase [Pseudomonadota bacterium]
MKLTILGSGSPEAYARRASSGYLLEAGSDTILFDCGGGVFDNLLRSGRKPTDISHIFFSHLHSDHMMDYARLIHAAWDAGGGPVSVFGPPPIASITDGYFGPDGVLSHDLRARTEHPASQNVWRARGGSLPRPWPAPIITEIEPGFSFDGDGWRLESCEVPHVQPFLSCLAFSVKSQSRHFVYSGDAGASEPLEALAKGADFLLHWCYRLDDEPPIPASSTLSPSPSDIARMAERIGVGRLLITHFRIHMDEEAKIETARAALRKLFSGQAGIAEDLEVFEL